MAQNNQIQEEVKDALLCLLADNKYSMADSSHIFDNGRRVDYNRDALNDAIIVVMEACGYAAYLDALNKL